MTRGETALPRERGRLVLRIARPPLSRRLSRRALTVLALAGAVALAAMGVTLFIGEIPLHPAEVIGAILNQADPYPELVIRTLRLPRLLAAVLVGAALGMSGAIFQGITGNPLVAPDIIGVNAGASVAVVAVVVIGSGAPPGIFAAAGALTAALTVYLLSLGRDNCPFRIVLIGIGMNSLLGAAITYLLTRASLDQVLTVNHYLLGDVSDATWPTVRDAAVSSIPLMAIGVALTTHLRVLQLGDQVAVGVGARPGVARLGLIVVGVGLAAAAVTAAGPVGFVAFIAPHITRALTRNPSAALLPVSAAVGGALVVVADYAAQRLFEPIHLPVGVFTVIIAGPYFMLLLARSARSALL
ncbi:FecCD family ABC transporter permease [Pseudonocardia sp. GCM10023141]|uniref:FecCD family ABC transporter permease n=1 Tax=Pseudonocardia sp. GCM10023141 TaxID=3252653 RepID=UPI00362392B9